MMREKDIEEMVSKIFESPQRVRYPYHNLAHTEAVVKHVREMAAYYLLNEDDVFVLTTAAWFHDIGHLYGEMKDHEERGMLVMESCLPYAPEQLLLKIGQFIMATKAFHQPRNLSEEIICDADTYHFGTARFHQTDALVEKEMEIRTGKKYPHWHANSLQLLRQHIFYTEYCRKRLDEGKKQNIAWLESLIA